MFGKKKFKLGQFPYHYECPNCHHPETKMDHDALSEKILKAELAIKSDLPLFFQCVFCEIGLIKPIGYHGKPSFVVQCSKDNDIFSEGVL